MSPAKPINPATSCPPRWWLWPIGFAGAHLLACLFAWVISPSASTNPGLLWRSCISAIMVADLPAGLLSGSLQVPYSPVWGQIPQMALFVTLGTVQWFVLGLIAVAIATGYRRMQAGAPGWRILRTILSPPRWWVWPTALALVHALAWLFFWIVSIPELGADSGFRMLYGVLLILADLPAGLMHDRIFGPMRSAEETITFLALGTLQWLLLGLLVSALAVGLRRVCTACSSLSAPHIPTPH